MTFIDSDTCPHEVVEERAAAGRKVAWHIIDGLPVPDDLSLPTCTRCGARVSTRDSAERLDAAMKSVYAAELADKVRTALGVLVGHGNRQRDIEPLLGLSAGYLSKVKNGKAEPSPQLAAAMMMLAVAPAERINELKGLWPAGAQNRLAGDRLTSISKTLRLEAAQAPSTTSDFTITAKRTLTVVQESA